MGQLCGKTEALAEPRACRNNIIKSILIGPAKDKPHVSIEYPLYNVDSKPCYEASNYTLRVRFTFDLGLYAALKSDAEERGQERLWYFTYEDDSDPNCYVLKNLAEGLELKFVEGWTSENLQMPDDLDPYVNLLTVTATQQQLGKPTISVHFYVKVACSCFDKKH